MADRNRREFSFSWADGWMCVSHPFCFLSLFASLHGPMLVAQTLQLSSTAASRGTSVVIEISLKSPEGKEPAALQWDATIPTAELSLIDKEITVGPAAKDAGKSITCAVKGKTDKTLTSVCILAGGQRQIQNGVIALLMLKVPQEAPIGPARVQVERAIAVSRDVTEVLMKPIETVVSIRGK
jgi:hypothetical protein